MLSLRLPEARLGYDAANGLHEDIGRMQQPMHAMQPVHADRSSGFVAIDGHVIGTGSSHD